MPTGYRKKLIEVALPLDAINAESAREKSIRHGHPSTLHLWWARRPLAACRAVLFASLVDDPGNDLPPEEAKQERERLFRLIEQLVKWENSTNEAVLSAARAEIMKSTGGNPPPVLDPFCGGGSIPLEAQRLGLEAHASDLNPVAVLITKALIELPAKFRDHKPVNPDAQQGMRAEAAPRSALADDVRWYGRWMRDEAYKRIGHLYPRGTNGETVIAWLWARTVKCPNPACGAQMPLIHSFWLSTRQGAQAWIEPVVNHAEKTVRFEVRQGTPTAEQRAAIARGSKTGRGANFACLVCRTAPDESYIKSEGMQGRLGAMLMAVVAEGSTGRIYLPPHVAYDVSVPEAPDLGGLTAELPDDPRNIWCKQYGLRTWADLFTPRQLVALTTFSNLVGEARSLVLVQCGGDSAYADAVATYLALAASKSADYWSSLCMWRSDPTDVCMKG
jgi:putative DNA methylase